MIELEDDAPEIAGVNALNQIPLSLVAAATDNYCKCFPEPGLQQRKIDRDHYPYLSIYEKSDEFRENGYFLPNIPIEIKVNKTKDDPEITGFLADPVSYIINIKHGIHEWHAEKRWKDFKILDKRLKARHFKNQIPNPLKKDKKQKDTNGYVNYGMEHCNECPYQWPNTDNENHDAITNHVNVGKMKREKFKLPEFPKNIPKDQITERRVKIEAWLQSVIDIPEVRNFNETAKFLEVSRFSFTKDIGEKSHEGIVKKRIAAGGEVNMSCSQMCLHYLIPKTKRWLVVKDSYLFYIGQRKENIRLVILMDEKFKIKPRNQGMMGFSSNEFVILNEDYKIYVKCNRKEEAMQWKLAIRNVTETSGAAWLEQKRFRSTYPIRTKERKNFCQTFIDGSDFWERAAEMMERAREEIFIGNWWLTPEMFLKKPINSGSRWRIDHILKRAAERGVRVFVLLFKEFGQGQCSQYCKRTLQDLHKNIKVIRHPEHEPGTGVFLWSHHEKLLVVDQIIAFVGGIDITFGRWDNYRHPLTDIGFVETIATNEIKKVENALKIAVKDATAAIISDSNLPELSKNKENPQRQIEVEYLIVDGNLVEKDIFLIKQENGKYGNKVLKMIKMDGSKKEEIAEAVFYDNKNGKVKFNNSKNTVEAGPSVSSEIHVIQITDSSEQQQRSVQNLHNSEILSNSIIQVCRKSIPASTQLIRISVNNPNPYEIHEIENTKTGSSSYNVNPARRYYENAMIKLHRSKYSKESKKNEEFVANFYTIQKKQTEISRKGNAEKIFPGKDYVNFIHKDVIDGDQAFSDLDNRYDVPRMPWHDGHSVVYGEAARDVARHFIQRWNAAKRQKIRNNDLYPYLIPKAYDNIQIPNNFITPDLHKVQIQLLRSVSRWSALTNKTEDSIQRAYISLIKNSKHYIYIENQFFVSMINNADISNLICKTICDRIIQAHRNDETFRVFLTVPLLAAMEGDIQSTEYNILLTMLHFLFSSLSRGSCSLITNLREAGVEDPFKYLCITSLRTCEELSGKLVSELIYVHAKFMIVDDLHVIIGSANINDRSMVGDRDSELAFCITDKEFVKSKMNGKEYSAGKHALEMRQRCMKEHLGLLPGMRNAIESDEIDEIDVSDPISDSFFHGTWSKIAENNTNIFEEVFNVLPTNHVKTFAELEKWSKKIPKSISDPNAAKERLKSLCGNLVKFPLYFLEKENLNPINYPSTPMGYLPTCLFV
uniref:Phospholipase n=1 Tax=Panagrolaimus sp. ES5 TaxID=591445 RepID=A0AC34FDY7_9BILA